MHDDVVGFLVADEDQPGVLGRGRASASSSSGEREPMRMRGSSRAAGLVPGLHRKVVQAYSEVGHTDRMCSKLRPRLGMGSEWPADESTPALAPRQCRQDLWRRSRAVDGVSLRRVAGEFIALLGPNGAGKTTLFQLLSGLFVPDSGRIEVMGHDMRRDPVPALASSGSSFSSRRSIWN